LVSVLDSVFMTASIVFSITGACAPGAVPQTLWFGR
jgi:hypothetical protein